LTELNKMTVSLSPPAIGEEEVGAVAEVLRSGWIGTGPKVQEFERNLSNYIGVKNAVAVSSCTAALHLSLLACGVKEGDEVVTTPMTFASTANVIVHIGAKPVFADIRRRDFNIDPSEIKRRITKKTKAIMPVHIGGLPCDMKEIQEVADSHGIPIVEDAAHALGAKYGGKMIGASGNLVCFSFYPTKNITSIEGGLVCTPDSEVAELIKVLRMHGQSSDAWKRYSTGKARSYKVTRAGFKYNMTDVQAAVGIKQLEKIQALLATRKMIASVYQEELKNTPGIVLPVSELSMRERVWHLFSILVKSEELGMSRETVMEKLGERGVGTGIHFESLTTQPFYQQEFGYKAGMYPEAEYVSERTLSLPLSGKTTKEQAVYSAENLKSVLKQHS
jgi:dTDP-4-amino-4,6-dideoxygalactose transaminase